MIGSQVLAGVRYRFPDHEYENGMDADTLFVHCYDTHGGITSTRDSHFEAHKGVVVDRLYVKAQSVEQIDAYLGFGARIVNVNTVGEIAGKPHVEVVIDIPPRHTGWLIDRLASGLYHATREELQA